MIQGTEEWLLARVGKVTASRVHDIVATTKSGGFTAGRKNYLAELVTERLTGEPAPSYQNGAMVWGIECEPEARAAYVKHTSSMIKAVAVEEVGFVEHPTIANAGCSPDGLVGGDGLIEIKCPFNTAIHLETLLTRKVNVEYMDQMQFQMACTGRKWCDFVSYDKRLPNLRNADGETMRLFILRVPRDEKKISDLELETNLFLNDLDATVDLLRKRYMAEAA
jgi:putative phage-type endonuclease